MAVHLLNDRTPCVAPEPITSANVFDDDLLVSDPENVVVIGGVGDADALELVGDGEGEGEGDGEAVAEVEVSVGVGLAVGATPPAADTAW